MLGRVAVHLEKEDADYLSYVRDITQRLNLTPHFIYLDEQDLLGDLFGIFSRPLEEKQSLLAQRVGEIFRDFTFQRLSGTKEENLTCLQEQFDLLFVKYRRQLFGKSLPEWLLSEIEGLRLWVYKEGASPNIGKVCLPVDFSERSLKQVEFVETLRTFFPLEYQLIYAVNVSRLKGKLNDKDYRKSLADKQEEVKHLYTDIFGQKEMKLVLLEGDPYREMVRYINGQDYHLVVVGRRGKGMRERIGSVSLHLIRSLKCPVVVL
ncbi:MAG: universal stress protein [Aquificaceae bacterium]|nr:universal stress protein [Aquificaceae bacterium]MCX8059716.1 universal stress protein [Aquificaceae bacterium]MDW8097279.1 universal stress protein [Aquificaceae bacterium]